MCQKGVSAQISQISTRPLNSAVHTKAASTTIRVTFAAVVAFAAGMKRSPRLGPHRLHNQIQMLDDPGCFYVAATARESGG
ncbi:hypothetical protein MCOR25_009459 [Pyricularia grisea]|nr:hypothetical protein MCOR25_009459 [Pyricularia grisea]